MRLRKVISRPIVVDEEGVQVRGGVNAAVSANVTEPTGASTRASTRQRIVQRSRRGRTSVTIHEEAGTHPKGAPS